LTELDLTFKMAAMTSARHSVLHMQQRPPAARWPAESVSAVPDPYYIRTCWIKCR